MSCRLSIAPALTNAGGDTSPVGRTNPIHSKCAAMYGSGLAMHGPLGDDLVILTPHAFDRRTWVVLATAARTTIWSVACYSRSTVDNAPRTGYKVPTMWTTNDGDHEDWPSGEQPVAILVTPSVTCLLWSDRP